MSIWLAPLKSLRQNCYGSPNSPTDLGSVLGSWVGPSLSHVAACKGGAGGRGACAIRYSLKGNRGVEAHEIDHIRAAIIKGIEADDAPHLPDFLNRRSHIVACGADGEANSTSKAARDAWEMGPPL